MFASDTDLHPLLVDDLCSGRQQPKPERPGEHLYLSLWDMSADRADDLRGRIGLINRAAVRSVPGDEVGAARDPGANHNCARIHCIWRTTRWRVSPLLRAT